MSNLDYLAGSVVLLVGLGTGCGAADSSAGPAPASTETLPSPYAANSAATDVHASELYMQLNDDLSRLNDLQVVLATSLILNVPEEALACYGLCPGTENDPVIAGEIRRQAPRVARLTAMTSEASASTETLPADPESALSDLEALRGLDIVTIDSMVREVPVSSPSCYNLPCPEELARANAENRRRAGVVKSVAAQAVRERL